MDFDAELAEPSHVERLVAVEPDDRGARLHERLRGRLPGAREPDDEDAPAGELEPAHLTAGRTGGSRDRRARSPEAQKIAQTIQNRTMIFVSDHAFISK